MVPDEVRDWAGFGYLSAGSRTLPSLFPTPGDWSKVKGDLAANKVDWRAKLVILDRADVIRETPDAAIAPSHPILDPATIARIRRAVPQAQALIAHLTGGQVALNVDVVLDEEPVLLDRESFAEVLTRYLRPKINGGRYDAEDNVFRGPYGNVFVLHPLSVAAPANLQVQNTPVEAVSVPGVYGQETDGGLALALVRAWVDAVRQRAAKAGVGGSIGGPAAVDAVTGLPNPSQFVPKDDWASIVAPEPPLAFRLANFALSTSPAEFPVTVSPLLGRGPIGVETTAKLEKDPQRGTVLTVEESGLFRTGGIALPRPAADGPIAKVADTSTFTFLMKSNAQDPIVFRFSGPEGSKSITVGRDVAFAFDNQWHPVALDLKPLGLSQIDSIALAPNGGMRRTLGPTRVSFADFKFSNDPPDPKPTPEAPGADASSTAARAAWAITAEPGEARRKLLKDPDQTVRANALAAAFAKPDPADETVLIEDASFSFEPAVFIPALQTLAKLGTPTSQDALRQILRIAAADRAKGLAAELLAASGDTKLVPMILPLNQARTRAARISAVRALGRIPGNEAALMRMAFLPQDDPEIKLEVTLTADANDDYQARKLLWSAVNEPSDAVRLESLRRLSESKIPEFRSEGLKGVRDDSVGVRIGLLQAWAASPNDVYLPSIRLALTDRSPFVRAAAIRALGAQKAALAAEDLKGVLDDTDPEVQLALLEVGKARGLTWPAGFAERAAASPDPRVKAAAKG